AAGGALRLSSVWPRVARGAACLLFGLGMSVPQWAAFGPERPIMGRFGVSSPHYGTLACVQCVFRPPADRPSRFVGGRRWFPKCSSCSSWGFTPYGNGWRAAPPACFCDRRSEERRVGKGY